MQEREQRLERLLRSAATVKPAARSLPLGFDTRVLAIWRSGAGGNGNAVAELLRRVAVVAATVIVIATATGVREVKKTRDALEPLPNEFAIADTLIQEESWR